MKKKEFLLKIHTQEDLENTIVGYFNGQGIPGDMLSRWVFDLLWGAIQIATPEILREEGREHEHKN